MPLGINIAIAFAVGGLGGLLIGVLIGGTMGRGRKTVAEPDARLENELRQQLTQRDGDMVKLRLELAETGNARAAAEASRQAAEKILAEQKQLHEQTLRDAKAAQDKGLADLRDTFKALSADALKQSAPEFLRLAEQTFGKLQESAKGDLAQRQESIKVLVEPLRQQLETYQNNLQQSSANQASTLGEVKKQMELLAAQSASLAQETQQFRLVLHSNQARGRWGEETLRRVVEAADDVKRAASLLSHASKLKGTIKALADRDYPRQFPGSLDYVVLFMPAESLFSAALEGDHDLIVWAAEKRILLATPASLIALLRSVSVSWQQQSQTENAQKIAAAAQEFYARVVKFTEHFEKIRSGLDRANSAFNDAASSFQLRVRPAGDRLAELGGGVTGKESADIQPLDATLRLL